MPGVLPGDAASYLGEGLAAAMPAAPANVARGTVAVYYQTDTQQLCFYLNGTWACEAWVKPGPKPDPGPDFDAWACNVAGFLTYDVIYLVVKVLIDVVGKPLLTDLIAILVQGVLVALLPATLLLDEAFVAALTDLLTSWIAPNLVAWTAFVADQTLWARFHCYIYNLIVSSPSSLTILGTATGAAIAAFCGLPLTVANGLALILQKFGVLESYGIPLSAFIKHYDCTTCGSTGQSDGKILPQINFDLVVTDGVHTVPFASTLTLVGGVVSGSTPNATLTIPSGDLSLNDGVTTVADVATIALSVAGSLSSPAPGEALVTFPALLELTDGVHDVLDVAKITVSGATVGGTSPNATLVIPTPTIGVDDGSTHLSGISELTFSVAGSVAAGSAGQAIVTFPALLELTDGTHDILGVAKLTVTGATVGGTSPNATLVIPNLELTDGTHDLARVTKITVTNMLVGGTASAATLAPVAQLTLTDGTHTVANTTQVTVTGATVGGTSPNATLTVPVASITVFDETHTLTGVTKLTFANQVTVAAGGAGEAVATITFPGSLELTDGTHDLVAVTKITVANMVVGGTAAAATLTGGATLELTDGSHDLAAVSKVTTSSLVVGGSSAAATLNLPATLSSLALAQWGYCSPQIAIGAGAGSLTVTFPTAYTTPPLVMLSGQNANLTLGVDAITQTTFVVTLEAPEPVHAITGSLIIWLALPDPTGNFVGPSHAISGGGLFGDFLVHAIQGGGVSGDLLVQAIQGGGISDAQVTTLTAPAAGATGQSRNPTFTWATITGASTYRLQVSTSSGFGTTVINITQAGTTFTPAANTLAAGTTYFWRVRMETGVVGSYSTVGSFTTA